jgi:predicted peptidase
MELKNINSGLLIALFFIITQVAFSQKLYQKHKEALPYSFWVYEPEGYDKKQDWPLIIFLHGRSLSGNDLSLVKKYGVIAEIEKGRKFPAVIIAPQVAKGESWSPDKLVECVNFMKKSYHIDSNRVSVTGMSLGGYGTLHAVGKYPDVFSCGAAFCGGGKASDACKLAEIPLWIAHGTKDEKVPYSESSSLVEKIKKCNDKNLKFTIFQDGNHGILERMFRTEELYDFLIKNKKGEPAYFPKYPDKK